MIYGFAGQKKMLQVFFPLFSVLKYIEDTIGVGPACEWLSFKYSSYKNDMQYMDMSPRTSGLHNPASTRINNNGHVCQRRIGPSACQSNVVKWQVQWCIMGLQSQLPSLTWRPERMSEPSREKTSNRWPDPLPFREGRSKVTELL